MKITLRYIDNPKSHGRTFKFKTLKGAQIGAQTLVGEHPKQDPDGYAVHRLTGNCLFFQGCTFEELFPQ